MLVGAAESGCRTPIRTAGTPAASGSAGAKGGRAPGHAPAQAGVQWGAAPPEALPSGRPGATPWGGGHAVPGFGWERKLFLETLDTLFFYLQRYSYAGLFGLILACGFGFPFSKTLCVLGAGILASREVGDLVLYMLVSLAALVLSDSIYFFIGFFGGTRVLHWRFFSRRHLQEALWRVEAAYRTQEWWAVFSARFTPFVRSVIFLAAGMSRMAPARFLAADILSALLLVPAAALAGYFFSEYRRSLVEFVTRAEVFATVFVLAALVLAVLLSRRKRR